MIISKKGETENWAPPRTQSKNKELKRLIEGSHHRAAQRREQGWEQLLSPSQEELSSTIGHQPMETLPSTTKVGHVQRFQFKKIFTGTSLDSCFGHSNGIGL